MATSARKQRKRLRRAALDLGYTGLADAYRYQHPVKTRTRSYDGSSIPAGGLYFGPAGSPVPTVADLATGSLWQRALGFMRGGR